MRNHSLVQIEGAFTKKLATYVPKLVEALALDFNQDIRQVCAWGVDVQEIKTSGVETCWLTKLLLRFLGKALVVGFISLCAISTS